MKLEKGTRLVMIGDSITDCGRKRPIGEGKEDALGRGYVAQVDALLQTHYPERNIRITNMGISGNTVRDLRERWQSDLLDLQPDWVSILIGINDVWRHYDRPLYTEALVGLEEYERVLGELVDEVQPKVKGLVLMAPYYLEPNPEDPMRAAMDRYGAAVRRIADAKGTLFVDTQAAFKGILAHRYPAALAWDRVHPNQAGHMVIAQAFLNAVGLKWNREPGAAD